MVRGNHPLSPVRHAPQGFTLVEILIVVIILGILAALVVPKYSAASNDSKATALASTCRNVQQKVIEYHSMHGTFPAAIDPQWFAGKALPKNPFDPLYVDPIEYDTTSETHIKHPRFKVISASNKPFWYNVSNGTFRARVKQQSATSASLKLYNKANGSNVSTYFGQTD